MLFVDSTVWIDYFNGAETPQTGFLHRILEGRAEIVVGDRGVADLAHFSLTKRFCYSVWAVGWYRALPG